MQDEKTSECELFPCAPQLQVLVLDLQRSVQFECTYCFLRVLHISMQTFLQSKESLQHIFSFLMCFTIWLCLCSCCGCSSTCHPLGALTKCVTTYAATYYPRSWQ